MVESSFDCFIWLTILSDYIRLVGTMSKLHILPIRPAVYGCLLLLVLLWWARQLSMGALPLHIHAAMYHSNIHGQVAISNYDTINTVVGTASDG